MKKAGEMRVQVQGSEMKAENDVRIRVRERSRGRREKEQPRLEGWY